MEFADWLMQAKGQEFIDALRKKSNTPIQYTLDEKEAMIKNLQGMLDLKKISEGLTFGAR